MANLIIRNRNNIELPVNPALTLLQLLQRSGVDIPTRCGGHARCGRCRVTFLSGMEKSSPRSEAEQIFCSEHNLPDNVRLACQTVVGGAAEIMIGQHSNHPAP